ncbi:multidrug efflux SMR transporter [Modestobacter sp. NPDC049651]|uniref:DMT family transporter n=1 Tax=unclassified Modestobacter TaxID=2643866 RepID=UPI0033FCF9B5
MAYLLLAGAIAAEVTATSLLPRTHGFTAPGATAAVVAGYLLCLALLAQVVRTVPVGVAYAIWSAVGTVAVVVIGAVFLGQPLTGWQVAGVTLVVAGVALLHLGGAAH